MSLSPMFLPNDPDEIPLSKEETTHFIKEVLNLDFDNRDVQESGMDKQRTLNNTIRGFYKVIPFNNLELISCPKGQQRRPTLLEMKNSMLARRGGLCFSMNTFFSNLLRNIGFANSLTLSSATVSVNPPLNDHVVCLFEEVLEQGDKHLVEVGFGMPTFSSVPLNFTERSPIYHSSFQKYFYKVNRAAKVSRIVTDGISPGWTRSEDGTVNVYTSNVYPRNLGEIKCHMDYAYSDPNVTPFLTNLKMIQFPSGKALAINNYTLLSENGDGTLDKTKLEKDLLVDTILDHFPMFQQGTVEAAVRNFQEQVFLD